MLSAKACGSAAGHVVSGVMGRAPLSSSTSVGDIVPLSRRNVVESDAPGFLLLKLASLVAIIFWLKVMKD